MVLFKMFLTFLDISQLTINCTQLQIFVTEFKPQVISTNAKFSSSFPIHCTLSSHPVTSTGHHNQQLQSQQPAGPPLRMPPPTSGGINEPQECPYCRRTFSCYYSLKRHFQDKHEQSDTLYVCEFCHRRYRTKNSLTTHKSLQHRGSSGMLKRLLKTTAIKSVLGQQQQQQQQQQALQQAASASAAVAAAANAMFDLQQQSVKLEER